MTSQPPKISVILAVYNGEKYLAETINSILAQTYRDFELIVVNDCSSDRTSEILSTYEDERILIVNNSSNVKISRSRNRGLELARGQFIAVSDADDISLPERFEKQVEFLERHADIGVVGCQVKKIDGNGKFIGNLMRDVWPEAVKWGLFFGSTLAHPAAMMRTTLIKSVGGYSNDIFVGADYELWTRLIKITRFANLPEYLLLYRIQPENVSSKYRPEQKRTLRHFCELFQADYIGAEKAKKLVDLINLDTRSPSQAVQAAELIYFLYQHFNKIERLSLPLQFIVRRRVGYRIHLMVSPFHRSFRALVWLIRAYFLSPGLIKYALLRQPAQDKKDSDH